MTVTLPPDAEKLVIGFLLTDADVAAVLGSAIYSIIPSPASYPVARIIRFGGVPPLTHPFVMDTATLQIDVWGDRRAQAQQAADTMRAVIAARLEGDHADGTVSSAVLGLLANEPDTSDLSDKGHPRPRCRFDLTITTRVPRGG